jgi:Ca2+-binding EF-hand superfamily protein
MDSSSINDLQPMFEFELKRKLSERAKNSAGEKRILLNGFKYFDLDYTGIINKDQWIQGILRTGLSGFNKSDLESFFQLYDQNNSGQIDYKNFCAYLCEGEPLNPLSKNYQSLRIQQDNTDNNNIPQMNTNMNMNQYQDSQSQSINNNNNQYNNNDFSNNNINQMNRRTPMYNNNQNNNYQNNINNQYNNNQYNQNNQRNQINYNNNNTDNFRNSQRTPLSNNGDYEENSNFRRSQRKINSYSNTFNNIFQQEISPSDNNSNNNLNNNSNLNESQINSIIASIRNSINTNNGITLYTFIKNINNRQLNNTGISLNDLNSIFQEMRINISLNDLKILFNILNKNQNNNISVDELINLIKGNLDTRRKLYISGIFSNIDTEETGAVSIQTLKNIYDSKKHPDVVNGTKRPEEAYEQFCYSLDLYCEINGIPENGNLSFENFVDYYSGVSACIPDEVYFEDILNGVWNN